MTDKLTRNLKTLHAALQHGEVVAFPTDTVFGLGADATHAGAVKALRRLKGRDADKPLQVLVGSLEQAQALGGFSPGALRLAQAFWPGALTLIVPKKPSAAIADNVCGETVGLRWPKDFLLAEYGQPVAASSANRGGEPPLESAEEIAREFGVVTLLPLPEGEVEIACAISGESVPTVPLSSSSGRSKNIASTVIEIRDGALQVLREGSITRQQVESVWNH